MTRLLVSLLAALLLAGCASLEPAVPITGGDTFAGRLSVRVEPIGSAPARSLAAAFDLRGTASAGSLGLSSPLGSMLAQARWQPGSVVLVTPQGSRRFTDLDALTREVLGESVPIEAWFDWLHGRPWPGAASTPQATAAGFDQLGWTVDLSRFATGAVSATRREPLPPVGVRIQLDGS
ncbi:lipoprotein insertase outer membrane protein LolB [Ideonella sp.]|uniref:lipoprotein insertase outer membrane protein LolB n=1 Tax=Ideonella sp. TaxID=1929293 RepID=UPI00351AC645